MVSKLQRWFQNVFGPIVHHPMSNYQVHLLAPLAHNNESHPFGPNDRPCMTINKRFKGIGPSPNLAHCAVFCAHKFLGKKDQKVRIRLSLSLSVLFTKGSLIPEDIFSLVPLPTKSAKSLLSRKFEFPTINSKQLIQIRVEKFVTFFWLWDQSKIEVLKKFSFSEKATKICAIFFMVWTFTK